MHKNISGTIFYSLLFAMGGAPTIAMLIIQAQTQDPNIVYGVFIGLSVIIACILVPLILIQNAFLFFKRNCCHLFNLFSVALNIVRLSLYFFAIKIKSLHKVKKISQS